MVSTDDRDDEAREERDGVLYSFLLCTVLVTGAASGVGRCVVVRLSQLGYSVVAGDVNQKGLEELKAQHPAIEIVALDVTNLSSVNEVVAKLESLGGVYGLINVAGISNPQPVLTCSEEQMKKIFEVNTFGPMRLIKGLYSSLKQQKGIIINVTSVSGKCAWPWQGFYASTKFALEGFSDLLRREIERFGVRTVLIEPGPIFTPMLEGLRCSQAQWLKENSISEFHALLSKAFEVQERNTSMMHFVAIKPEKVAEVIAVAIGSVRPRSRYLVATPAFKIFFWLLIILPDRWADFCLENLMG